MIKNEYIALSVYVIASTAGVLIIKNFMNCMKYVNLFDFISQLINVQMIIGVLLYIIGFLTWLFVLSKMNLSSAYPVAVTLSFIAIIIMSSLLLNEKLSLNIFIGMLLCLIGIVVILR